MTSKDKSKYKPTEYQEYLESTLGRFSPDLPNKDKIVSLLDKGADINSYFIDKSYFRDDATRGSTLLFALIDHLNKFQGKKNEKAVELIELVLKRGADPNLPHQYIDEKKRKPTNIYSKNLMVLPLSIAVSSRYIPIIKLLVQYGAKVRNFDLGIWKDYMREARSATELEKTREIMRILDPEYKNWDEWSLNYAIEMRNVSVVKELLKIGREVTPDDIKSVYYYLRYGESPQELEKMRQIAHLVQPSYQDYNEFESEGLNVVIDKRAHGAIKRLVQKGQVPTAQQLEKWMSFLRSAKTSQELQQLRETMKVLKPNYRPFNEIPGRPVPYNAINIYSQDDIQDRNILVNLNKEYYGQPGVVGSHSHFYRIDGWNMAKKKHNEYQEELLYDWAMKPTPIKSPMTRRPIQTVNVYRAEKEPHPVEQNFRAIQTNLFQGGKRKTRKLKRKTRAKTAKWTQ
jgi:hypothetical protein